MTPAHSHRNILRAHQAGETIDGPGLRIRRAIPGGPSEAIGPFILLDHFGPVQLPAGTAFPPNAHPHAGIETLTYLLEGSSEHRDSAGHTGAIEAHEAQWMRAGRGVIHDEGVGASIRERGGTMQALQLWINLPRGHKHAVPAFSVYRHADIPQLTVGDATVRLLAGEVLGARGPVNTFAHPFAAHVSFPSAGTAEMVVPLGIELGLYVMAGAVQVDGGGALRRHDFADLSDGDVLVLAAEGPSEVLLLGGPPLDAPLVRRGPFVMNSHSEIEAAIRDFQAGRMGSLPQAGAQEVPSVKAVMARGLT